MSNINNPQLITELTERGFVYQLSTESLDEIFTGSEQRHGYLGVDPTADSIHVGNLVTYILAQHLINAGHKMTLLVGGATGQIGDPKADGEERPLQDETVIASQAKKLQKQLQSIDGLSKIKIVNNYDWFKKINILDFLRDVGKHFTVNNMMKKESVARRLQGDNGISFTEFSYALIQGYDFYHLNIQEGCDLQIGGSDQWGNIISGVEFIRKKLGKKAYALTLPLIVDKATGKKFGKSEGNAVWLDSSKTSYYQFYQFWLNCSDESVIDYLKLFTFLSLNEIAEIKTQMDLDPGARIAQNKLAFEVTKFVHGEKAALIASRVSELMFSNMPIWEAKSSDIKLLLSHAPVSTFKNRSPILDVLVETNLASSKREAREFVKNGAIKINGELVDNDGLSFDKSVYKGDLIVLQRGKKQKVLISLV